MQAVGVPRRFHEPAKQSSGAEQTSSDSISRQAICGSRQAVSFRARGETGESSLPLTSINASKGGCELNLFKTLPRLLCAHNVCGCFSETLVSSLWSAASARIMFGRNDCGGKSPNGLGCCVGRVVVAGAPSGGDRSGRRIQCPLGQQLTGRGLTHRPRVARVRGPLGVTACDVLLVGYAEIGQRGTVVDAAVGPQAAQIPPPGVDLDWVQVRLPLGPLRAPRYLISASTVPWVIAAPVSTANPVITPSLCAVTGFSIFIPSRTTTRSPVETSCPSSTATLTTVPCIGAVTASPDAAAPPWAPRLRGLGFLRMTP